MRLIGVDTPETSHPTYGEQPYGQQAKEFTVTRLEGRRVALEFDLEKVDPYGRLLAYLWPFDGRMFNDALLMEGYAQVATFPPNVKRLQEAQRKAREANRGLWGLSKGQLCQQADRGNGIGGGCDAGSGSEQERPSLRELRTPMVGEETWTARTSRRSRRHKRSLLRIPVTPTASTATGTGWRVRACPRSPILERRRGIRTATG